MKIGILGLGEIGQSILNIVNNGQNEVFYRDLKLVKVPRNVKTFEETASLDVLHICIPYSKNFVKNVELVITEMMPNLTIIESTIPIGTTDSIYKPWIKIAHSPVRGNHSHLTSSIKTFIKFIGGPNASQASCYYRKFGIKTKILKKSKETEMAKLLCTTYYGWNIIFCRWVKEVCEAYNIDFNHVYTLWNQTYNEGYEKMGQKNVIRPILKYMPGKIGGHCIIPNAKILQEVLKSSNLKEIPKIILKRNK